METLTNKEYSVASLIATDHHKGETATALNMSVRAVEGAIRRVYRKLDINSNVALAWWYASHKEGFDYKKYIEVGKKVTVWCLLSIIIFTEIFCLLDTQRAFRARTARRAGRTIRGNRREIDAEDLFS